MALNLSNALLTVARSGTTVYTDIPAQVEPSKLHFTPVGPQRIQTIMTDPGLDIIGGDYVTATFTESGRVRVGTVTFPDDVEGADSYMALTVVGGLLSPT